MTLDYVFYLLKKEEYDKLIEELNDLLDKDSTNPMYYYYRFLAYNKDYSHIDYNNLVDEMDLNRAISLERDYSYDTEFQLFKLLNKKLRNIFLLANRMDSTNLNNELNKKMNYDGLNVNIIHHLGSYIFSLNDLVQLELTRNIIEKMIEDKEFPLYNELDRIIPLIDYLNRRIELKGSDEGLYFTIERDVLLDVKPKSASTICIPDGVVEIAPNAFKGFTSLKIVKIPESVLYIGKNAFSGCEALIKMHLPSHLREIGENAFRNCKSLPEIKIPDSIKKIDVPLFAGCKSLQSIELPIQLLASNPITSLFDDMEFEGSLRIRQEATPGNMETFYLPRVLHEIIISKDTNLESSIPSHAFENLICLDHIVIPEGVKEIHPYAFKGLKNLSSIDLPESITKIDYMAFQESGLEKIILKEGLNEIGAWAFLYCDNLKEAYLPLSIKSIGYHAFGEKTVVYSRLRKESLKTYDEWTLNPFNVVYDYKE